MVGKAAVSVWGVIVGKGLGGGPTVGFAVAIVGDAVSIGAVVGEAVGVGGIVGGGGMVLPLQTHCRSRNVLVSSQVNQSYTSIRQQPVPHEFKRHSPSVRGWTTRA